MNLEILGLYLLGLALRVVLPFVQKRLEDPTLPWDWRYVVGQFIGAVLGGGIASVLEESFPAVPAISWLIYAWFSADLGRLVQKTIESRRA